MLRYIRAALKAFPTLLGALVLGSCGAMLIFNMLAGTLAHANGIRFWSYPLFAALKGTTERVEKTRLTVKTALDGSFQAAYARQVGARVPIFEFAVRLRNQVEFSLFSISAIPSTIIGVNRELIELVYTEDYCSRSLANFLPGARLWAGQVRAMQDVVERQGKTFLYVVTPSKVGQYPEFMPSSMPCPAASSDRAGLVPAWLALVRAAGVHVVDTTSVITAAHGRYPFALYPQYGTHWNAVGATLAGQAVASELSRLRHDPGLNPLAFQWRFAPEPVGPDDDLAALVNLLWLPPQDPTPEIEVVPPSDEVICSPLHIAIIGGSFGHAIGDWLSRQRCYPDVIEYEYWHTFVLTWDNGQQALRPFSEAERARDLHQADILIYEDNEEMLGRSQHGRALYDYVMGHGL